MLFQRMRAFLARLLQPDDSTGEKVPAGVLPDTTTVSPNFEQTAQLQLKFHYQQLARNGEPLPSFDDVQFRAYSQNGEDGILLYVFSLIGITNKRCVEICAGEGIQCNTANLIINHGWSGLLLDGDDEKLKKGRDFYRSGRDTHIYPPKLVNAWISQDNINDIIRYHNFAGDIDLLSLDMDGIDYWIWKAMDAAKPRVVILEYQNALGPDRRVTQRYTDDFYIDQVKVPKGLPRGGASLGAFVALARKKGYRLVGCERLCFNAVFIKQGVGEEYFPEISAKDCFHSPLVNLRSMLMREKEHLMPDIWEEV